METTQNKPTSEKTPKVTGIGGIFFFSDDPKETKQWYTKHLGLEANEWGATFESRNMDRKDEINTFNGRRLKAIVNTSHRPKRDL